MRWDLAWRFTYIMSVITVVVMFYGAASGRCVIPGSVACQIVGAK